MKTLRNVSGLSDEAPALRDTALVMIDCQNTYREGVMTLAGVEAALSQAKILLDYARQASIPIFHVRHDAGAGSPYDLGARIGQISDEVAPQDGETVIDKHFPNAFVQTDLEAKLKAIGAERLVLAGFMTHMCIDSTARGAFSLGFSPTVVASATATRDLPDGRGGSVSAASLQTASLAALRDLFAVVVDSPERLL